MKRYHLLMVMVENSESPEALRELIQFALDFAYRTGWTLIPSVVFVGEDQKVVSEASEAFQARFDLVVMQGLAERKSISTYAIAEGATPTFTTIVAQALADTLCSDSDNKPDLDKPILVIGKHAALVNGARAVESWGYTHVDRVHR